MPTKLKRYSVSFPDDILPLLREDCRRTKTKVGTKILSILAEHYQSGISQPMIFGRPQPLSRGSRHSGPIVFRAPSQPKESPASEIHEKHSAG